MSMTNIPVNTQKPYNIRICASYADLPDIMEEAGPANRRICIVTDSNVAKLYLSQVQSLLNNTTRNMMEPFIFEAGESSKNLATLEAICVHFLAQNLDRKSLVVALGGGVTGDLAGFAASAYMRGIDFVQLPTTLLAQVDASVGGKTGVDLHGVKNIIGAFYQPRLVCIAMETLATLSRDDYISGLAEVVKHGLIAEREYYQYVADNAQLLQKRDLQTLTHIVEGSCRIKAAVVTEDELETGRREILNFGHCVGHAVESLSGYRLPHGHSVAIGMAAALELSSLAPQERAAALKLLQALGLPTVLPDYMRGITAQDILAVMQKDKKNRDNRLRIVLLKQIGEAYTEEEVSRERLAEVVARL